MRNLIKCTKLTGLFLMVLFASCKKDSTSIHVDIMQHYIAGKFTQLQSPQEPFALIPISANKAIFVSVNGKLEVDYIFEKSKFKTKIQGAELSCDIKNGDLENITINSTTLSIPIAVLNKKDDATLSLAGKRFEAPLYRLDNGTVLFDNYYFRYNADAASFNYNSNPTSGNYLITTKTYEKLADGCFYAKQAMTFGVMLNDKLEITTKIGSNYAFFSGTKL